MTIDFVIGIAVLIGLFLFLYHEVRRSLGPMEWGRTRKWQKRLRVTLAAIPVVIGCCVFWGFFIEPNRLVVRHERFKSTAGRRELV